MPRQSRIELKDTTLEYIKSHAQVPKNRFLERGEVAYLVVTSLGDVVSLPNASACCSILEQEFPATKLQMCILATDKNKTDAAIRSDGYLSAKQVTSVFGGEGSEYLSTFHVARPATQVAKLLRWILKDSLSRRQAIESDARFQARELKEKGRHYGATD